ncbi:hypothetical protein RYX36_012387 [Vicia faba]
MKKLRIAVPGATKEDWEKVRVESGVKRTSEAIRTKIGKRYNKEMAENKATNTSSSSDNTEDTSSNSANTEDTSSSSLPNLPPKPANHSKSLGTISRRSTRGKPSSSNKVLTTTPPTKRANPENIENKEILEAISKLQAAVHKQRANPENTCSIC